MDIKPPMKVMLRCKNIIKDVYDDEVKMTVKVTVRMNVKSKRGFNGG